MGQVFRARDTKLGRDVAIKILPDAFASDPERLVRFEREARTLASLNHPHIAAIYAVEGSSGTIALVMELVEGEDLSAVIARGPISLSDALPISRQIAEALEAAHEQGIIHRDLKPANIKLKGASGPTPTRLPDGRLEPALSVSDVAGCTVKVLDFGLAKAMDPASGSSSASSGLANSPTMTSPATQMGMILGTAAYMSPEQARGRTVDRRADIWAFGVVLYEMLTGRRAFEGEDVSDVLAAVLRQDIDWTALPVTTPPRLRRLLERCLDRDVKTRLRDIGEARIEIARIEAGSPDSLVSAATTTPAAPPSRWSRLLPWAAAGLLGAGLAVALFQWAPWRTTPVPTPRTLLASIGADASLPITAGASAILSPDATMLAFVARQSGQPPALFARKLDQLQATALAGTDNAASPFFSPDGQWIGFFADAQLKKVSVTGGAAIKLSDAPNGRGGTWTDDDAIVFTPESGNGPNTRLKRVPAAGGAPADFVSLSEGAVTQRWPQALPGGVGVLYTEHSTPDNWNDATLVVASLSGETSKIILRGGYYGRYVAAPLPAGLGRRSLGGGGHLIYMNQGTLFAVRFDLDRLEVVGPAVPVLEGIATSSTVTGGAQLALSTDGTLVYLPGGAGTTTYAIDWITREGSTSALRATRANWSNPRFSPDGRQLAIEISDGRQYDIWVQDLTRDTLTQLTFEPGDDRGPVWSPDGQRLAFASDRAVAGVFNLYWMNADGTGEVTRLTDSPDNQGLSSWHPSGRFLAFGGGRTDLSILPVEGDPTRGLTPGTATAFLATPAAEGAPMFSPDGRWIAYTSGETLGTLDIYVRPFPGPGGPWRISTTSGTYPRWSLSKPELLFLKYQDAAPSRIMAATYTVVGDSFRAETPYVWSPTSVDRVSVGNDPYDLHPDGTRIAAAAVPDEAGVVRDQVVFVFNFADYLSTLVPRAR
jgi:serine/threonine protein kinase/Tol biopolymer transport system component